MNPIIVPVRNDIEGTKRAIESFKAQDVGDVRIFIVDNTNSTDVIDDEFFDECGLFVRENKSVSESWNFGLMYLFSFDQWFEEISETFGKQLKSPYEINHVLVCNNDIILRPETYRLLLEDGGDFVTGGSDESIDCLHGELPENMERSPHPDFACFLIRRKCWETVGPFDENFKGAYCEDNDYHLRMNEAGIDSYRISLPFYHKRSGTIKSASPEEAAAIHSQADANRAYFKRKWGCLPGDARYYEYFKRGESVVR